MSNVNSPFGLKPVRKLAAGCSSIALSPYKIASGLSSALYRGSPVKLLGTGRNIDLAAATDVPVGVFAGFTFVDALGRRQWSDYWPAGTTTFNAEDAEAMVWDDPDIIFEAQFDTLAKTDEGALCNWVIGGGSPFTQMSSDYAQGSASATSGKMLRILGLANRLDNDYGAYAIGEVMFAAHTLRGVTSGAGGV